MDYLSNNVAVNLKRIRKSKSMSLDQVSEQTGVVSEQITRVWDRVSGADTAAESMLAGDRFLEIAGLYNGPSAWDTRLVEVCWIEVED